MNKWIDGWMDGRRMGGWVPLGGWMNGWMDDEGMMEGWIEVEIVDSNRYI